MNKKEKTYFISRLFENHINLRHNPKMEYYVNFEIIMMFKNLDLIDKGLYDELAGLLYESAYDDKYSALVDAQKLLCDKFGIKML